MEKNYMILCEAASWQGDKTRRGRRKKDPVMIGCKLAGGMVIEFQPVMSELMIR